MLAQLFCRVGRFGFGRPLERPSAEPAILLEHEVVMRRPKIRRWRFVEENDEARHRLSITVARVKLLSAFRDRWSFLRRSTRHWEHAGSWLRSGWSACRPLCRVLSVPRCRRSRAGAFRRSA